MALSSEFKWGIVVTVVVTAIAAGSPWWWQYMPWEHHTSQPPSAVAGMSGGCAAFEAYAQNRYPP